MTAIQVITHEAKQLYLKRPDHCPFCGNEGIETDEDMHGMELENKCYRCNREWADVFVLSDVRPIVQYKRKEQP